jgi:uncharacterized protein (DUF1778 family)
VRKEAARKERASRPVVRGPQQALPKVPNRPNPLLSLRMIPEQMELLESAARTRGVSIQFWSRSTLLEGARSAVGEVVAKHARA